MHGCGTGSGIGMGSSDLTGDLVQGSKREWMDCMQVSGTVFMF